MTEKRGDRVYTPHWCAADMVRHFAPEPTVLEPCRGEGAIWNLLPPDSPWCEIDEGVDFFARLDPVDWIMTNPPYSETRRFLRHALRLARHVVFLVPARNIFSGYGCVREAAQASHRMREIRWYGTGSRLGFPMGNAIAAIHWSRTPGPLVETFYDDKPRGDLL